MIENADGMAMIVLNKKDSNSNVTMSFSWREGCYITYYVHVRFMRINVASVLIVYLSISQSTARGILHTWW